MQNLDLAAALKDFEPTNAPLMVIDSQTRYGFLAIDPLGDTWIEAEPVIKLWRSQGKIPVLRSWREGLEIWFVSLDWLIGRYPDMAIYAPERHPMKPPTDERFAPTERPRCSPQRCRPTPRRTD